MELDTQNFKELLNKVVCILNIHNVHSEYVTRLERLNNASDDPCVIAVVGPFSSGKSTLINALLGMDIAPTGVAETTSTINYFRYGISRDPSKPVRVHWKNGKITEQALEYVSQYQGYNRDIVEASEDVVFFEFLIDHPLLKKFSLVDTPGTDTQVVKHEKTTLNLLKITSPNELVEKKVAVTSPLFVDAIIYMLDTEPSISDYEFLSSFHSREITQGSVKVLNAIGVFPKVDIMKKGVAIAEKRSRQLKDQVNTVVAISAAIEYELSKQLREGQKKLEEFLEGIHKIGTRTLEILLESEMLFNNPNKFPETYEARLIARKLIPDWTRFRAFAKLGLEHFGSPDAFIEELRKLSGFSRLYSVLDLHIAKRATVLRCSTIIQEALQIFRNIAENSLHAESNQQIQLKEDIEELEMALLLHYHSIIDYVDDFKLFQKVSINSGGFSDEELDEIRTVLGVYGHDIASRIPRSKYGSDDNYREFATSRQMYWLQERWNPNSLRREIATHMTKRYGWILAELSTKDYSR